MTAHWPTRAVGCCFRGVLGRRMRLSPAEAARPDVVAARCNTRARQAGLGGDVGLGATCLDSRRSDSSGEGKLVRWATDRTSRAWPRALPPSGRANGFPAPRCTSPADAVAQPRRVVPPSAGMAARARHRPWRLERRLADPHCQRARTRRGSRRSARVGPGPAASSGLRVQRPGVTVKRLSLTARRERGYAPKPAGCAHSAGFGATRVSCAVEPSPGRCRPYGARSWSR